MKKHEQTIKGHAESNVAIALDQSDEYGGLEDSFDAFCQNTLDSALEDNYSGQEAMDAQLWFIKLFNEQAGTEF